MNQIKTLVLLQLKDKIDFSSLIDKKTRIRTVIFAILKFLIITAVSFLIMFFSCIEIINIFTPFESPRALILVMSFLLILSIISCTYELMKNLYFAEDNRVLITLPVNSNLIFISKIIVFEIYELKKSFSFLIPITFGCLLFLALRGVASFAILIWCWFAFWYFPTNCIWIRKHSEIFWLIVSSVNIAIRRKRNYITYYCCSVFWCIIV